MTMIKNAVTQIHFVQVLSRELVRDLAKDARGQDLIEYALMAAFVAVAAGAIFPTTLMPAVSTIFSKIDSAFTQASSFG